MKKGESKPTKKRAKKYEEKLKLNGSFHDVIRTLVRPNNK